MLVNAKKILQQAKDGLYAVPQFNINNLEGARYILEVCNENNSPVILGVSEGAAKYMGGYLTIYRFVTGLISDLNIKIPVVLNLDHASSVESCKKAINAGFTSVMFDGSNYSIEENIKMTNKVVKYASFRKVTVEAEIGHIGGAEDGKTNDIAHAKLEDCIKFVKKTKINFLAPALGSVHGLYNGKANIDLITMKKISENVKIPLVLHGGTGIPDDTIKKAIVSGVCKININTDLQVVWSNAVRAYLLTNKDVYDPRKINRSGESAMKKVILEKIKLFKSDNRYKNN